MAEEAQEKLTMYSEIIQGREAISLLASDWDDLFARATDAPPHLSRAWVTTFIEFGRICGIPLVVASWSDGKLVALLPLAIRRFMGIKVAVPIGTGQPSYLGLLRDPKYPSAIQCIAETFSRKKVADVLCIEDLSSEDDATNVLLTELSGNRFLCLRAYRNHCRYIRLDGSFEEYLKNSKSRKTRQELHRKERKLYVNKGAEVEYYSGIEVTPEILRRIAGIQEESWMKRRGVAVLHQSFYQKLLSEMAKAGFGSVRLLRINGEDVAFAYILTAHKKLYYAWTAFKLQYATSNSVGVVLTMCTIRKAFEEGITLFDFGHGDGEFKRRWANECHYVHRVVVSRGLAGRLISVCYFVVWRLTKIKWLRSLYHHIK